MKKTLLIVLAVLMVVSLVAATPAPLQKLSGTLRYERTNDSVYVDYVEVPLMGTVYLKGLMFPSQGQYEGCHISALGLYVPSTGTSALKVFQVRSANIACPDITAVAQWTR